MNYSASSAWALLVLVPVLLPAQSPLSLADAVERARTTYPSVQVSMAEVDAAAARIKLARTSFLPRLDSIAQVNRATRNNIFGMLLQQRVISPISGPPVLENSTSSVFGSAVGLLVEWEPFDFGLRKSQVDAAEMARRRADRSVARSQFEAASAAADSYLTVLAAQQTVRAAQSAVERSQVLLRSVEALVGAELRPGADAETARAEVAAAQAQVIRAEQAVEEATAVLAGLLGEQPGAVAVSAGKLLELPGDPLPQPGQLAENPVAQEQDAAVEEARARLRALDKEWVPKFSLQGTTYARGTGAQPDFTTLGGANGLAPNFYNWGLGFSVTFPLLDQAPIKARQAEQSAKVRAEEGRYKLIVTELETRKNRAIAAISAARRIADLTPTQLQAARTAEGQVQARYRAGLATLTEVADSQRVLAQAETDDALARLAVWRAILALRVVEGDLAPFLRMAGQ